MAAPARIMKAHEDFMPWSELQGCLQQLRQAAEDEDVDAMRRVLRACVHGFQEQPAPQLDALA